MNTANEIAALETKVGKLQIQQNIAEGKLEVAMESLKENGFNSVEEAENWLVGEEKRLDQLEDELIADLEEFNATYAEYLT